MSNFGFTVLYNPNRQLGNSHIPYLKARAALRNGYLLPRFCPYRTKVIKPINTGVNQVDVLGCQYFEGLVAYAKYLDLVS